MNTQFTVALALALIISFFWYHGVPRDIYPDSQLRCVKKYVRNMGFLYRVQKKYLWLFWLDAYFDNLPLQFFSKDRAEKFISNHDNQKSIRKSGSAYR
jgi:hypothetical protein